MSEIFKETILDLLTSNPYGEVKDENLENKVRVLKKQNKYFFILGGLHAVFSVLSAFAWYAEFNQNGLILPPYDFADFSLTITGSAVSYFVLLSTVCGLQYRRNKKYLSSVQEEFLEDD